MTLIGNIVGVGYGGGVSEFLPPFAETLYRQEAEGDPLKDATGTGPDLPYVSGFGVDQIFDFSPLADNRWNKNAYIGNAFTLPEYYDFPYSSEIYFDTANPYHWKIKDCHYRFYEEQADSLTNISFAKLTYDDFGYGVKCTTSGLAYHTSTDAYGEWEIAVNKAADANTHTVYLISADQTASSGWYQLQINAGERLVLRSAVGDLFFTALAYIANDTDYFVKIVRNSTVDEFVTGPIGTFAVYIKGGAFGASYVLVDPTGGTGTNPITENTYTTSAYTVLDLDAGDKIRDYTINGTLQNFNTFTQSTGTYEIDNLKSSDELLLYQEGKGLDCVVPGEAYKASTDAYGIWEFDFIKASGTNIFVYLVSGASIGGSDNYSIRVNTDERIYLRRGASVLFFTDVAYLLVDTKYSIRVTRNSYINEYIPGVVGAWAVYIKGGAFGSEYVLVDPTGGGGVNPVGDNVITTSTNTVLDLDAGDNIANYSINGTLLDTRDFTQTTGEYVVTSELEDPELSQIKGYVRLLPPTYLYYIDEQ